MSKIMYIKYKNTFPLDQNFQTKKLNEWESCHPQTVELKKVLRAFWLNKFKAKEKFMLYLNILK